MKKILVTVLALPFIFSSIEAQAVSPEELIRQKQENAANLRQASDERVEYLKNADRSKVALEDQSFTANSLSSLEPASGSGPSAKALPETTVGIAQEIKTEAKTNAANEQNTNVQTSLTPASPSAPAQKSAVPIANSGGVI